MKIIGGYIFRKPNFKKQQAGNGPSRRHIQGSNIAKGLQSVKNSLLQYPHEEKVFKNPKFFSKFFWSPGSRIVPKNVKGDLKKALLSSISSASRSSAAFSVSSSQLIKLIKSVTSLVLKKSLP